MAAPRGETRAGFTSFSGLSVLSTVTPSLQSGRSGPDPARVDLRALRTTGSGGRAGTRGRSGITSGDYPKTCPPALFPVGRCHVHVAAQ
ncbi:hypothetical protein GCM10009602_60020 [Nocardiopsis tropica]